MKPLFTMKRVVTSVAVGVFTIILVLIIRHDTPISTPLISSQPTSSTTRRAVRNLSTMLIKDHQSARHTKDDNLASGSAMTGLNSFAGVDSYAELEHRARNNDPSAAYAMWRLAEHCSSIDQDGTERSDSDSPLTPLQKSPGALNEGTRIAELTVIKEECEHFPKDEPPIYWLDLSASLGDADAQRWFYSAKIQQFLCRGDIDMRDSTNSIVASFATTAQIYAQELAASDPAIGNLLLAEMHRDGIVFPQDNASAIKFAKLAEAAGNEDAGDFIKQLEAQLADGVAQVGALGLASLKACQS